MTTSDDKMAVSTNVTHDPLCPDREAPNDGWLHCEYCDLIERVRDDERYLEFGT